MGADLGGLSLTVSPVGRGVDVAGDPQILSAAISNLVQNAFKFSRPNSQVAIRTLAATENVVIEVEDECGGLPAGDTADLFRPFEQQGANRSGVGLGLSICLKAAKASAGEIRVRDLPGKGCVFTLDLPRKPDLRH